MKSIHSPLPTRRNLLLGGLGLAFTAGASASNRSAKPLRGIFPIAQTPFTSDDRLDVDSLVEELRFIDRGGVHGFVWPQLASEWQTLTEAERFQGAEAIAAEGAKRRPAIVLGVQAPDTAAAVRYARHAEKIGADAIISLPPSNQSDPGALVEYYRQIGNATSLPLFVQAVGNMSVETVLSMYRTIPSVRYVKDEAGQPLARFAAFDEASKGELKVFTGGHGKTLIDEMMRGFAGSMPAASFADVYASAWNLWQSGKRREAVDEFGAAAILIHELAAYPEAMKYILYCRGVFKTYQSRPAPSIAKSAPASDAKLDEKSKKILRDMLDLMQPHLKVRI